MSNCPSAAKRARQQILTRQNFACPTCLKQLRRAGKAKLGREKIGMPRVKRGKTAHKRRKKLLKHAKGFKWGRKTKYRQAKEALLHAWSFQFADRRKKKGQFRRLWQIQIGAAAKQHGVSYNKFINGLKRAHIELDRKILSDLAQNEPEIFKKLVELLQASSK